MTVNERVKILQESMNLSQGRFAARVGVNQENISRAVTGKSTPSYDLVEKIYRAFPGLSARWLLSGEGEMWESSGGGISQVAVGNGNHQIATLDQCRERVAGLELEASSLRREVQLLRDLVAEKERVIELMRKQGV